jgi:hypothetical protein
MRDIEHKLSRAIVDTAVERQASIIAIGDVRDAADKVDLGKQANQTADGITARSANMLSTRRRPKASKSSW